MELEGRLTINLTVVGFLNKANTKVIILGFIIKLSLPCTQG